MTSGPDGPTPGGARRRVAVVPHTHWDREWYRPFQSFRLRLVDLVDELLDLMERDPLVQPLPPRRAAGRRRRLPRDPTRARGAPAGPDRRRADHRRSLVRPHGRVPGVGGDDRAQPAEGHRAGQRLRGRDGGRLPARHVRPHRPDAPAPRPGRLRARRRLARGAVPGRLHRLRVVRARRVAGPGRVPRRRLRQRRRTARGRQAAGPPAGRHRGGVRPVPDRGRPHAVDERLGPSTPAAVARAGGGRGQRAAVRVRPADLLPGRLPLRHRTGRARRGYGRAPFGVPLERADGGGLEPRGREAGGGAGRTLPRATGRAARRRSSCRRHGGRRPSSTWRGPWSCATPPTTRSAPARPTRSSTPSSTATPRPVRSATD